VDGLLLVEKHKSHNKLYIQVVIHSENIDNSGTLRKKSRSGEFLSALLIFSFPYA
jgi:hypothetical protein